MNLRVFCTSSQSHRFLFYSCTQDFTHSDHDAPFHRDTCERFMCKGPDRHQRLLFFPFSYPVFLVSVARQWNCLEPLVEAVVFGQWCVLCSCRDPGDLCPSFRSAWLLPHSRSKILAKRWAAMVSKRKRGSPGFQDRCARRKCWRSPSQLTGERSGFASSVPRPVSGRGGDADDAPLTSLQGCKGSTDRLCRRKPGSGHQDRRPREVKKERGPETRMRRITSCERKLNSSGGSREWRRGRECKAVRREENAVLKKIGTWTLTRRLTIRRSFGVCKSLLYSVECRLWSPDFLNTSCQLSRTCVGHNQICFDSTSDLLFPVRKDMSSTLQNAMFSDGEKTSIL